MKVTRIRYLAGASSDFEQAVGFYESREPGLGERVVAEIREAIRLITEFPEAAPSIKATAHRHRLRWIATPRFPIKIVFAQRADMLIVVAIFHQRRRPNLWRQRLKDLPP